jgi:hypothetical protein
MGLPQVLWCHVIATCRSRSYGMVFVFLVWFQGKEVFVFIKTLELDWTIKACS